MHTIRCRPAREIAWPMALALAFVVTATAAAEVREALPEALEVQILLARAGFSPGALDGRWGANTRGALEAFQRRHEIAADRRAGETTWKALRQVGGGEPLTRYQLTAEDLEGPFAEEIPDDLMQQAKLERLAYTSPLEALAEKFHTTPRLLRQLNPDLRLEPGAALTVPQVEDGTAAVEGEGPLTVTVSESGSWLQVADPEGAVVFYAAASAGSRKAPLPIGEWEVTGVAEEPEFRYDPDLFWDSAPTDEETVLPPGPNNPVGVVWIDLSKEHYGIHGTSEPATIGYAQAHGCVRLTNWDARRLARMVETGTRVIFEE